MSWNTSSPDLTECMKHSLLRLLPPAWQLLALIIGLLYLRPRRPAHLMDVPVSALQIFKILLALAFSFAAIADLVFASVDYGNIPLASPILIIAPSIEIFAMVIEVL